LSWSFVPFGPLNADRRSSGRHTNNAIKYSNWIAHACSTNHQSSSFPRDDDKKIDTG
jgi:hypothetical protein